VGSEMCIRDSRHGAAGAAYSFQPPVSPYPYAGYPPAGYPSVGYPPAGYPNAPGYGGNPNGTSALGGMMNSLLGSFTSSGTTVP